MTTDNTFQNDMFATVLINPQASFEDFVAHGYNSDNTGLLHPDEYKKLDKVKEAFTKDGVFDEETFNRAYLTAAYNYNELADEDLFSKLEQYIEYSPTSIYAPLDKQTSDWTPTVEKIRNPFENTYGLNSLFGVTETEKSNRELAQTNTHYFDWDKQKWIEESPDDFGISGLIKPAMTYAIWTEDGYHKDLETGQTVQHKKGEWKTDQNGRFYMETVGDREQYGLEVASVWDTLTSEGTFMNSINVFESDDKEKSIAGTTVRLVASLFPYFIPGFNKIWGGFHMLYGLASVAPALYKSIEGTILGGDNKDYDEHNMLWQFATKAENWFSKFKPSVSDEGRESLLNYEQLGQIVGDVFAQIYEQRAAASIAGKWLKSEQVTKNAIDKLSQTHLDDHIKAQMSGLSSQDFFSVLAKKSPELVKLAEKQQKLAKQLSLGYMALTQSAEVYREGIEAGFDRRAAGVTSLLAIAGQYGLMMNNRLGDWFLEKTAGYTKENINKEIRKALLKYLPEFETAIKQMDDAIMSSAKIEAKTGLLTVLGKAKKSVLDLIKNGPNDYLGSAGIEAIEEVTEEAALDLAKGITNTLSWLGVWRNNSQFYKEGFFTEKTLERYITSAVGGAVGGALFRFNDNVIAPKINGQVPVNQQRDLIDLIADGHTNDILNEISKIETFSNISTTPINIKGIDINLKTSSNGSSDLNKVASGLSSYVKWMSGVLNQSGFAQSDAEIIRKALLDKQVIKLFKDSKLDNFIIEDFKTKVQSYVDNVAKLESVEGDEVSPELKKSVETSKQLVEDILTGKQNEHYMQLASLVLNKNIREAFDGMDFVTFAENYYKKPYSDFSEEDQKKAKTEYEKYIKSSNVLDYLNTRIKALEVLESKFSKPIKEYIDSDYIKVRKRVLEEFYNLPKTEAVVSNLVNYIDFSEVDALVNKTIIPELLPLYHGELNIIKQLWKDKDSNSIKQLEEFLQKLEGSIDESFKPEIQSIVNNLNNNKQVIYNLLDELHQLEQRNKSGIFFNTYFKTDVFKQLNKALGGSLNTLIATRAKDYNLDLTEEEIAELNNKLIQDLSSHLLNAPMFVIKSTTTDILIKNLMLDYSKELSAIDEEYSNLIESKQKNKISEEEALIKERELLKKSVLYGVFNSKLSKEQFDLLKEVYSDYWNAYVNANNVDEEDLQYSDSEHISKIKTTFYNKLNQPVTAHLDRLVNEGLDYIINYNPTFYSWGDIDYSEYDKSGYYIDLNLYESSFEDYFKNLEYLDEEELNIYLDLKLKNAVESLDQFKNHLDLESLPKILKEAYYSGQDVYEVISKMIDEIKKNNPELKDVQINPTKFKLLTKGATPEERKSKIKTNPIYKILNDLELYIGTEKVTLFSLIDQLKISMSYVKFSEFVAKDSQIKAIEQALKTVKMLNAIIDGMVEQDTSFENPFGFNTAIINYLNKYKNGVGVEKYNLITSDEAKIIKRDIKKLMDQLESVLDLSKLNSGSQLQINKKMQENFQKLILERFKNLGSCTIDGKDINVAISNILSSDKQDDEKLLELENLLYTSINLKKNNLKSLLKNLKLNEGDIIKKTSYGLSATTTQMSDYDFINWLGSILTVRSSDFRQIYIDYFKNLKEPIAPLFGQKLAIQLGYSFVKSNPKNNMYKHILDLVLKDGHKFNSNLYYVSAIGGAGKSSVIARTIFELVKKDFDSISVAAPNITALNRLKDSILKGDPEYTCDELQIKQLLKVALTKSKTSGLTDSELKDLFAKSTDMQFNSENSIVRNDKNFKLKKDHGLTVRNPKDWESQTSKLIFIDEVTNFSTPVLQALNMIAEKAGIKVVTLGDDAQLGLNETIDDLLTIGSIKLSFSMRYDNKLKLDNDKHLSTFLQQTINDKELPRDNDYIDSIKKSSFTLSYYQSESQLIGDKIVKSLGDELKLFKKIIDSNSKQKILIITETGELSTVLKNKLNDVGITKENYRISSIDPNSDISVQGDESEYVIVDSLKFGTKDAYYQFKKLYTSVSRSLTGSLFYDPESNIFNTFEIVSVQKPFEPFTVFTPETINKLTENTIVREEELLNNHPGEENKVIPPPEGSEKSSEVKGEENEDSKITFTEGNNLNKPKDITEQQKEFENLIEQSTTEFEKTEGNVNSSDFEDNNYISENESNENIPSKPTDLGVETEGEVQPVVKEVTDKEDLNPIQIHPFYNRIGCVIDSDNQAVGNSESNEDLNIFNPDLDGKYSEDQINCFLFFKNIVSLYSDSEIKKLLKKNDTSGISNKIIQNLGINIRDLNKIQFKNVFLNAKYYNDVIDDPIGVFEYSASEKLTNLDNEGNQNIFITLSREVVINDKSYFITISAFPQISTLTKAVVAGKINQKTLDDYITFENGLRTELTKTPEGFIKEIGTFDEFTNLINDTTGVRVDSLENGFIDFSKFSKYKGLYYNPENITSLQDEIKNDSGKKLAVTSDEYITGIAESMVSKTVKNRDKQIEEKKSELRSKLFDDNGFKLRGFPVLKMYVTPEDFRYIPLYPKSRTYEQALNELDQFKNKPAAFMDSTSTFNLIWAITPYKNLFLEQLQKYINVVQSNKGLKNALEQLVQFLNDITYDADYTKFKNKYYQDYMNKKIYKGSAYYISQQIKNLEEHEFFINIREEALGRSTTSIIKEIKKSVGSKIGSNIVTNDQVYYSKSSLKDDDGNYKIDPDSLYDYYKISKSVQMPTLYLNMESIFKIPLNLDEKIIRMGTNVESYKPKSNQSEQESNKTKEEKLKDYFNPSQLKLFMNVDGILENISAETIINLYEGFENNYDSAQLEDLEEYDDEDYNSFFNDYEDVGASVKSSFENYIKPFFETYKLKKSDVFSILKTFYEIKTNCS